MWKPLIDRRHFFRAMGRGVFAILLAAALVLSDALPIGPAGLPEQVEAADKYPRTGTITFYKYTRLTNIDEVAKKNRTYDDFFMAYEYGGSYYAPYTRILRPNYWPVMKVDEILPHFSAEGSTFYSRTRIRQRKYNVADSDALWGKNLISIFTQYNEIGEPGDYNNTGIDATYENDRISPASSARRISVRQSGTGSDAKFQMVYVYGEGGNAKDWTRFYGCDTFIAGTITLAATNFLCYKIDSFPYTCINSNYQIGENQVYVADRDLILREGVKLTIPEGSVLCVKNGPFYVNGEIECSGTILVEDGGIIMPMESTSGGSRIVMKEGGAMIIRSGGRVYAGCPKGSLWTQGDNGWLDMYAGSSIINFGLLIAGQCNFTYGQATIENHKGGAMFLGYTVANSDENNFINSGQVQDHFFNPNVTVILHSYFGVGKSNGTVHYGSGSNQTVLKIWDGAYTMFANKSSDDGQTVKLYSYDNAGKCTVKTDYEP